MGSEEEGLFVGNNDGGGLVMKTNEMALVGDVVGARVVGLLVGGSVGLKEGLEVGLLDGLTVSLEDIGEIVGRNVMKGSAIGGLVGGFGLSRNSSTGGGKTNLIVGFCVGVGGGVFAVRLRVCSQPPTAPSDFGIESSPPKSHPYRANASKASFACIIPNPFFSSHPLGS